MRHRTKIVAEFHSALQSCSRLYTAFDYDVDRFIFKLAIGSNCRGDPLLHSQEFAKANEAVKWATLYAAQVRAVFEVRRRRMGPARWAQLYANDGHAKIEFLQSCQEYAWNAFHNAAVALRTAPPKPPKPVSASNASSTSYSTDSQSPIQT